MNLPKELDASRISQYWPPNDGDSPYNLLHVPLDKQEENKGVAFIDFRSAQGARGFWKRWNGQRLAGASKALRVTASRIQGFDANVADLRRQRVVRLRKTRWPLLFDEAGKLSCFKRVLEEQHRIRVAAAIARTAGATEH